MPHALIHHSKEFEESHTGFLIDALHHAILSTGVFPEGGLRVRAYPCELYKLGNIGAEGFVHIEFLIGHGRAKETLEKAGSEIFAALKRALKSLELPFNPWVSFEFLELHPKLNFKKNNLRAYMAKRMEQH